MTDRDGRLVELFGRRVSLRHRIARPEATGPGPAEAAGPGLTDAVGELVDGGAGPDGVPVVLVHTRRGSVRIADADVVAVRAVPPAPRRRASWAAVARLERLCADAWPAPVVRELGDWRLRAGADGFTRRANSALAVGDPGVPVPVALGEVRRFADEHAIPPVVSAPEGSPWWRAVRELGWRTGDDPGARSIVLVAGLDVLAAAAPVSTGITFAPRPGRDWWAVFGEDDDAVTTRRRPIVVPDDRTLGFGLARGGPGGTVTGAVRAALVDDHVYLSRLEVPPHARRGGVASALTAAAARWGLEHGGRHAVLQVLRTNTAARALYARMGCVEHHRYHYLVPGPDAAA